MENKGKGTRILSNRCDSQMTYYQVKIYGTYPLRGQCHLAKDNPSIVVDHIIFSILIKNNQNKTSPSKDGIKLYKIKKLPHFNYETAF